MYLSQLLGKPVVDATQTKIGVVQDLGIATEEVFPTVTIVLVATEDEQERVLVWRETIERCEEDALHLKVSEGDIRTSTVRNTEVLLVRDLLNKEIVDMRGMKVVHVDDIKLSVSPTSQLRLMGAIVSEPGAGFNKIRRGLGMKPADEEVVAWNYIDLLDRNLDDDKLMKTHKTLEDLHPADIADIVEQVDDDMRAHVLSLLDDECVAEAMAELDEEEAAEIIDGMDEKTAGRVLSEMDPDDAAELIDGLKDEKATKLLNLMGLKEQQAVRRLLNYRDETAGRIMTDEFVAISEDATVQDAIDFIRTLDEDFEHINYIYLVDEHNHLTGTTSLRSLIISPADTKLKTMGNMQIISAGPDEDQEDVVLTMSKYNLLALPILDESQHILGIVTADDALNIMEEEHEEDLQIAGATSALKPDEGRNILADVFSREIWLLFWLVGTLVVIQAFATRISLVHMLLIASALPICLHSASNMIRNTTSYYFDNDPEDDIAVSAPTFIATTVASYFLLALVIWIGRWLLSVGAGMILSSSKMALEPALYADAFQALSIGILAAIISSAVSYLFTPLWLRILRSRDEQNLTTSGMMLNIFAYAIATILFVASIFILTI